MCVITESLPSDSVKGGFEYMKEVVKIQLFVKQVLHAEIVLVESSSLSLSMYVLTEAIH